MFRLKYLPFLLSFSLLSTFAFGQLNSMEKSISTAVDAETAQALLLLEEVVNINSGTMNFAGVKTVGKLLAEPLQEMGFRTEWLPGKAFNRAGHLVAHYGSSGPKILLIGHLDTVFSMDDEFQKFKRISETHASGPGTTDMKGGDIVLIYALRALQVAGALDNVQVRVVMTGDEEHSGRPLDLSKKALVDAALWADYALGFEDGDSNPKTAVISRRSSSGWELLVSGRPAHSSQIFREGYGFGAIYETARILNAFREQLSEVPNLTFNPGLILGGTTTEVDAPASKGNAFGKTNVIAETTIVRGDIRSLSPEQEARARKIMREIVSNSLANTQASISFGEGYPPMAPSAGNVQMLGMYDALSQDLGYGSVVAVDPRQAGAADISFTASEVEMAMDGLGLMGSGGHTVDEIADLRTLPQQTKRAALLIYRLSLLD